MIALLDPVNVKNGSIAKRPKKTCQQPKPQPQQREAPRRAPIERVPARPRTLEVSSPIQSPPMMVEPTPPTAPSNPPPTSLTESETIALLNKQAAVLENIYLPAQLINALGLEKSVSVTAARLFLGRFRDGAGGTEDSIEQMLVDQLALAHLKVAELYARAEAATALDFKQLYSNAATKLVGAICQLTTTLVSYRNATKACRRRGIKSSTKATEEAGAPSAKKTGKTNTQLASKGGKKRR